VRNLHPVIDIHRISTFIFCLSHNLAYLLYLVLAGTEIARQYNPEGGELDPTVCNRRHFKKNSILFYPKSLTVTAKTGQFTANRTGKGQLFCIKTEEQKRDL